MNEAAESLKDTPGVRCFFGEQDGTLRRKIWVMTRKAGARGAFFHGDREEIQAPRFTVEELSRWSETGGGFHEVIEASVVIPFELHFVKWHANCSAEGSGCGEDYGVNSIFFQNSS